VNEAEGRKSITITRKSGYYGFLRTLIVTVDGEEVARLKRGQSVTLENLLGDAVIRGRMDWGETRPFPLADVSDGAHILVQGFFTLNETANLGISALPFRFTVVNNDGTAHQRD